MNEMLLHATTKRQLLEYLRQPSPAILIYGPEGSGKQALAFFISSALMHTSIGQLTEKPYFYLVQKPEGKQEIPIEAIREIIRQLQLKPISDSRNVNRVVLIDGAHLLSTEAQNSLLKIIEEPPTATTFILTALSENTVLPTIASRTQKLKISPINHTQAINFFKNQYDQSDISSAWRLSGGLTGLLNALLAEDDNHPLKKSVEQAKRLLSMNKYQRILFLDQLSANKTEFNLFLDALNRVIIALHHSSIAKNSSSAARLLIARKLINKAHRRLFTNTSLKLIALDLAMALPV